MPKTSQEIKEYKRQWQLLNRDKTNLVHKRWRDRNKEKLSEQNKEYYLTHKDYFLDYSRKHRAENLQMHRDRWHRRKARLINAAGSHTQEEWENLKEIYQYTCLGCNRKEPEIKLTSDHKIPLSKGGSNSIDNIQPLCFNCNSSKHTKIWFASCKVLK